MKTRRALACACLLGGTATGATIRVPQDAPTIQAAIDLAGSPGDIVEVANGTYTGAGNRDLDFGGKLITVRSRSGDPDDCIIDCENGGRAFFFHNGEDATAVVSGFTITRGSAAGEAGGGILITPGPSSASSPTITDCIFVDNLAQVGGAMSLDDSDARVTNCRFHANNATAFGAGMQIISGAPVVTNCEFFDNIALVDGGAVNVTLASLPIIANCSFNGNDALNLGGGLRSTLLSIPQIANCIFWGNLDATGGGALAQIRPDGDSIPLVSYSIVQGDWPGTGNKDGDPLFVGNGNLRVQSGSPAVDAGNNTAVPADLPDLDGDGDVVEPVALELDGRFRFHDDPDTAGTGVAGNGHPNDIVDMGPYERGAPTPARRADILWRHDDGRSLVWLLNGTQRVGQGSPGSASQGWRIAGAGDFDGDDRADILWRNVATGQVFIWFVDGTERVGLGSAGFANPAFWEIVGTGDFDGDPQRRSDILWRNTSTGQVFIWLMDGTEPIGQASPGTAAQVWEIVGVGDFDGDEHDDILWRNTSNGQVFIWFIDGTQRVGAGSAGIVAQAWTIVGTGNFDADTEGRSDILWRNTSTGQVFIWLMDGTQALEQASPGTAAGVWKIVQVGDMDGDGRADILWRNDAPSGQVFTWFIDGTERVDQGPLGTVPHVWQIKGLRDFDRE